MPEHNIDELWDKMHALDIKCTEMSTDICWIKKVLLLVILLGLSALGVGVPQYFI